MSAEQFRNWLRAKREELGATRRQMDQALGRVKSWGNWELGATHPNAEGMRDIANFFGIPVQDLVKMPGVRAGKSASSPVAIDAPAPVEELRDKVAIAKQEEMLFQMLLERAWKRRGGGGAD